MLWAILSKSWKQHPTKQQLYSHQLLISKTIQIGQTRYAEHCWRSKDKLLSDVVLWTPSHGHTSIGWLTRTYLQQICMDTGCSLEDLLEERNDRDEWQKRVRKICATSMTWWYICVCVYMCVWVCVCAYLMHDIYIYIYAIGMYKMYHISFNKNDFLHWIVFSFWKRWCRERLHMPNIFTR